MRRFFRHFDRIHLYIFLGFYAASGALTLFALLANSESDRRWIWITTATAGSISGPFTGAIVRHFQSCCWQNSVMLFPYCAAILGVGTIAQVIPLPFRRFVRGVRLTCWCVGLLGWFGGVLVSFGHALS